MKPLVWVLVAGLAAGGVWLAIQFDILIGGGTLTSAGQHDNIVALVLAGGDLCGGTVVRSRRHVLTAEHCNVTAKARIREGLDATSTAREHRATGKCEWPQRDLSLVYLDGDVAPNPVPLASLSQLHRAEQLRFVGYGRMKLNALDYRKRHVEIKKVSSTCEGTYKWQGQELSDAEAWGCSPGRHAVAFEPKKFTCEYDSGGPALVVTESGSYALAGVIHESVTGVVGGELGAYCRAGSSAVALTDEVQHWLNSLPDTLTGSELPAGCERFGAD